MTEAGVWFQTVSLPQAIGSCSRLRRFSALIDRLGSKAVSMVAELKATHVILYGESWYRFRKVIDSLSGLSVAVVADCNEWHPLGIHTLRYGQWLDQYLFIKRVLPRVRGVIGISSYWADFCQPEGLEVLVVPALGPDASPSRRANDGVGHGKSFRVGYLGVLADRDRPLDMFGALGLARARGLDVRLSIMGAIPERRVSGYGLATRDGVDLVGWVADGDLDARLSEVDSLILLRDSSRESLASFPTRLPRLLLAERPVILSQVGDMPRYLVHRRDAWFVDPQDNARSSARAIAQLAADPTLRKEIGERAGVVAIERFSARTHAPRLLDFLESVM